MQTGSTDPPSYHPDTDPLHAGPRLEDTELAPPQQFSAHNPYQTPLQFNTHHTPFQQYYPSQASAPTTPAPHTITNANALRRELVQAQTTIGVLQNRIGDHETRVASRLNLLEREVGELRGWKEKAVTEGPAVKGEGQGGGLVKGEEGGVESEELRAKKAAVDLSKALIDHVSIKVSRNVDGDVVFMAHHSSWITGPSNPDDPEVRRCD